MPPKTVRLSVVRDERTRGTAKELRRDMFCHIGKAIREMGDDIAGYAVVVWDRDGYNFSSLRPGGPVQSRLIPSFASDALQQHVTLDLAKR